MALSDYLEDAILGHLFLGEVYTPPTMHLALFTDAPDDTGGGVEVTGGSYSRVQATFVRSAGAAGSVENSVAVTFTALPACTVVAAGLYDAGVAGNLLAYGDLPVPVTYAEGDNATAAIGAFKFTLA